MHPPPQPGAMRNEALRGQMSEGEYCNVAQTPKDSSTSVQFPSTIPVHASGRFFEPDIVMVDHAPSGENHGKSVNNQRWIEILKIPRTDHNGSHQERCPKCGPGAGAQPIGGALEIGGQCELEGLLARHEDFVVRPP